MLLLVLAAATPAGARPPRFFNANVLERDERAAGFGLQTRVRVLRIDYRAHNGRLRLAYVLLPWWYGPGDDPPIPLVISPHGRGINPRDNAKLWGNLPAAGDFAVVCPEGQGRRLALFAWGAAGDVADLARMPTLVERALPWLRVAAHRVYAFGSSMGGQEVLLLVARFPRLLAGAAAFDADTNLAERYRLIVTLPYGPSLRAKLVTEVGGTPTTDPAAYRARSPLYDASALASARVPLQIWWSTKDRVVADQRQGSGLLYRRIRALDPSAGVVEVVGTWRHSDEFQATRRLSEALSAYGLLPVRTGARLSRRQKRALELPADWPGSPLAIDWRSWWREPPPCGTGASPAPSWRCRA